MKMKFNLKLCLIWLSYSSMLREEGAARVVVVEGFGSNCSFTKNQAKKNCITNEVKCLKYISWKSSLFGNVNKNVEYMCKQLKIFANESENDIYLIGISQGGFVAYLLLDKCFDAKIKRFAAVGSPLLGTKILKSNMMFESIEKFIAQSFNSANKGELKRMISLFYRKMTHKNFSLQNYSLQNYFPYVYLRPDTNILPNSNIFINHFLKEKSINKNLEQLEKIDLYNFKEDKIVIPSSSIFEHEKINRINVKFNVEVKLNLCKMLINNQLKIITDAGGHLKKVNLKM